MREIASLDDWAALAAELREDGYSLSQWQYNFDALQGFHAWFWRSGGSQLEAVTRNCAVQKAIICFKNN
jgi:hypothetical protein